MRTGANYELHRHTDTLRRVGVGALAVLAMMAAQGSAVIGAPVQEGDWPSYHGNPAGDHFSALTQITPANVTALAQAWRIDTGEGGLQTTPLAIDGVLYAMSPEQEVLAIDGAKGNVLWRRTLPDANKQPVRGVSLWSDGTQRRLLVGAGMYLHALDPATGASIDSFGNHGRIDMR